MNTLDNLTVYGQTTLGNVNINGWITTTGGSNLVHTAQVDLDNGRLYVREGRLYFYSPELGEYSLTPTKEERVGRIVEEVDIIK